MKFALIDAVLEQSPDRIVAIKQVSLAEEYLADHFPSFPILPGVMMIEAMAQAARIMLKGRGSESGASGGAAASGGPLVLGEVKALKFGNMVRPGEALVVEVTLAKALDDGSFLCRGTGMVRRCGNGSGVGNGPASSGANEDRLAVSGRFLMRPVRTEVPAPAEAASAP